ncbi:hypothetical protein P3T27_005972 [Kitasatospora sp. MAA19]|nr:hypothetical protein [Kitasatospora sp. MAA19]
MAMRLEMLAAHTLPQGAAAEVALMARWAAFICWVDDQIDRRGLGSVPGELEEFTGSLRQVLAPAGSDAVPSTPHAVALARLWECTAAGMAARWRQRFTSDYFEFLDASEREVALRRRGVRLPLADYRELRGRTITVLPMLDVLECVGHARLVEEPRVDDQVRDLRRAVADVTGWANDLASAADDEAAGQDNLVVLLAREEGCSTAEARERVAAMIEERRVGFGATAASLRATPVLPADRLHDLRRYVDLVETFMASTLHWLAVTGRFTPDPQAPVHPDPAAPQPGRHPLP